MSSHALFDDVLLETTSGERRRRKLTLFATLAGESLAIAAIIAIPLLYLDAVPGYSAHAATISTPLTPAPLGVAGGSHDQGTHSPANGPAPTQMTHALASPSLPFGPPRPRGSSDSTDDVGPNAPWGSPDGVPGGTGTELVAEPTIPSPPHRPLVISHLDEGMVLQRVEPMYPALARETRTQGDVVLRAIISKDGRIEGLQVVSGHPLLAPAAVNAVSQWRFRPYQLNGTPIEVDAQITVRFHLGN